ncbi:MAG: restriction endonuclease subunit S [Algiphilus sp.]|uniref:restriction endonuclease subunit S n=1 Tax=Algiphilus sp. TaxID=1872431 RepID=UPI0032EC28D4
MSKKDKQHALVPRLRFPEFRDESGWSPVRLEDLAERVTTRNTDGGVTRVLTNSAEHGVLNQREYFDKDIATKGNLDGYYVVENGDFVYNPRVSAAAPVGPISRNNVDQGVMSPLYTVFRFNHTNTEFYKHYFKSTSWHSYLRSVSSTGARHDRMSITNADFMRMPVPNPHPDEQQKIADCLGSLDDLIAAEARKLAALRDHKKGLMQQLFPREGETRPRQRFPEFRDAGEWDSKTLEDVCDLKAGDFVRAAEIAEQRGAGMFPCYGGNGLRGYVTTFTHSGPLVLIGRQGALCGNVNLFDGMFHATEHALVATPKPKVDVDWLYYALTDLNLNRFAIGQAQPGLSVSVLNSVGVLVPEDEDEQQRIADCLSALDALIAAQAERLDALLTHKRGLMQQLFPAPETSKEAGG